ncbi:hypothetical protein GCM10010244_72030 [Streptomyces coeruleorubidus]|nr:hypothetical protein GCM10010244_72030 [Streptomyces bellus]
MWLSQGFVGRLQDLLRQFCARRGPGKQDRADQPDTRVASAARTPPRAIKLADCRVAHRKWPSSPTPGSQSGRGSSRLTTGRGRLFPAGR